MGEHDFAIFGRAVGAAEEVGNVPDETDKGIGVIGQGRVVLCIRIWIESECMSLSAFGVGSWSGVQNAVVRARG
jgi:hypothetical protein